MHFLQVFAQLAVVVNSVQALAPSNAAVLQAGVVRELSTSHAIVDGALVSTAVENGTHVVASARDYDALLGVAS